MQIAEISTSKKINLNNLTLLEKRKKSTVARVNRNSKLFKTIIHAIQEKKGERIVSLDLKKIPEAVTDFFIICEASNPIQLKAIADFVEEEVKKKCGETPYKHEGRQGEQWILIENVIKGSLWQWVIIGTGLNINQQEFDELNLKATSLKLVTGKSYDVLNLTKELTIFILKRIEELKSGKYEKLLDEYNQHLFGRNKMVKLKK